MPPLRGAARSRARGGTFQDAYAARAATCITAIPSPAAGVLIVENGAVLLVKRRFEPFKGLWVIPSGFIEYDEDVRAAAAREAMEETGLAVEIDALHAVETCFDDPRGNALLVLYRAHVAGGTPKAGDDAEEVGFFPLTDLPPVAFEAHRKVLAELAGRA